VIVIDSSIALKWVLPEEGSEQALRYVQGGGLAEPDILLVETANVLAKKVRAKDLAPEVAIQALGMVKTAVPRLIASDLLVPRAMELSIALSHPVYDCVFLACAEHLDSRLATRDTRFSKRLSDGGFGHLLEAAP